MPIVRERLLEMIEAWMESFRTHPQGKPFEDTYEQLRAEGNDKVDGLMNNLGIRFPERELGGPRVPVITPPARPGTQPSQQQVYPYAQQQMMPAPIYPPTSVPQQMYAPHVQPAYLPQQQQQQQRPYYPSQQYQQYPPRPPVVTQTAPPHAQRRKLLDDIAVVRESIGILSEALNACNPITV